MQPQANPQTHLIMVRLNKIMPILRDIAAVANGPDDGEHLDAFIDNPNVRDDGHAKLGDVFSLVEAWEKAHP